MKQPRYFQTRYAPPQKNPWKNTGKFWSFGHLKLTRLVIFTIKKPLRMVGTLGKKWPQNLTAPELRLSLNSFSRTQDTKDVAASTATG